MNESFTDFKAHLLWAFCIYSTIDFRRWPPDGLRHLGNDSDPHDGHLNN